MFVYLFIYLFIYSFICLFIFFIELFIYWYPGIFLVLYTAQIRSGDLASLSPAISTLNLPDFIVEKKVF